MHDTDTIAAIATPPGRGGIGIIRISGPESLRIAAALFRGSSFTPDTAQSHRLYHGTVIDPADGSMVDEVLLSYMRGPASYTGEDVVEINMHGGPCVLQTALALVCAAGARIALPGEFTRRAFCNGRIDLAQAEAVMDIIEAKTQTGLKIATRLLAGGLSDKITRLSDALVDIAAHLEASIDFPEDDIAPQSLEALGCRMRTIEHELRAIRATGDQGALFRSGVQAVIVGKPNVGKSSLMNALVGRYRAIVTPHPGTTRDIIQEAVSIKGIPVCLEDTAGLREDADEIERIGIGMTMQRLQHADVVLPVFDGSTPLSDEDRWIMNVVRGLRCVVVVNKTDLPRRVGSEHIAALMPEAPRVCVSARTGQGIESLRDALAGVLLQGRDVNPAEIMVTSIRHSRALEQAAASLARAAGGCAEGLPPELVAVDVQTALSALGEITGRTVSEDILDSIFSTFCIGK